MSPAEETEEDQKRRFKAEAESEKSKLDFDMRKAAEAKALMENPLLVEAFTNLRQVYTGHLLHSPIDKPEYREIARYRLDAIDNFENELRHMLDTGTMAKSRLDDIVTQERSLAEDPDE